MIHIQPTAQHAIERAVMPYQAIGIRIKVESSGCNGLAYGMEWCYTKQEGDHVFDGPKKVYVDPKTMVYLKDSHLVYKQDKFEEGFEFINPNEKSRCGCGESFYMG